MSSQSPSEEVDEKVLNRIRKLANTAGRTEEEAQLFATKVQELLARYKLDMTDIQFEDFKISEPVGRHLVDWKKHDIPTRRQRVEWIEDLAAFVAEAYFCRTLIHTGSSYVTFVGRKADAQVAEYVLVTLVRQAEKIATANYVKYFYECRDRGEVHKARGFRKAFLMGFVHRIASRLRAKREEMMKNSTALVRFSVKEVDDFIKENVKGTANQLSRSRFHGAGYDRGQKAANNIDLDGKAVGKGGPGHKQLG